MVSNISLWKFAALIFSAPEFIFSKIRVNILRDNFSHPNFVLVLNSCKKLLQPLA